MHGEADSRIERSIADFRAACDEMGVEQWRIVQETETPFTKLIELARYHDLMVFGLKSIFENDFLCRDPEGLLVRIVAAGVRPLLAGQSWSCPTVCIVMTYGPHGWSRRERHPEVLRTTIENTAPCH